MCSRCYKLNLNPEKIQKENELKLKAQEMHTQIMSHELPLSDLHIQVTIQNVGKYENTCVIENNLLKRIYLRRGFGQPFNVDDYGVASSKEEVAHTDALALAISDGIQNISRDPVLVTVAVTFKGVTKQLIILNESTKTVTPPDTVLDLKHMSVPSGTPVLYVARREKAFDQHTWVGTNFSQLDYIIAVLPIQFLKYGMFS